MSDSGSHAWFGHPRGLAILFSAELWERFSYYGMRALLVLYLIDALGQTEADAYAIYGIYGAVVYAFGVVGGALAQRRLGELRAMHVGGALMAAGHLVLALPWRDGFFWALALLCVGNGLFKPNTTTLVGALYDADDERRPHGYYLYYMGINLGAMLAPIVCGLVAEQHGWHAGFVLAGVGMLFGLAVVVRGRRWLTPRAAEHAQRLTEPLARREWLIFALGIAALIPTCALLLWQVWLGELVIVLVCVGVVASLVVLALREQGPARARVFALLVLMLFHTAYWAAFEQVGSTFPVLAEHSVDRMVAGVEIPATSLVAINGALVIVLAPLVAALWRALAARRLEPSTAGKFALGLGLLGLGFFAFALGIEWGLASGRVSLAALLLCYLLITLGELCLSPIGLALVGKLAPSGAASFCMGAWFMTYAAAHLASSWIAAQTTSLDAAGSTLARQGEVFARVALVAIVLALLLYALRKWLAGMIGEATLLGGEHRSA